MSSTLDSAPAVTAARAFLRGDAGAPAPAPAAKRAHYPRLDGLRGIAVVAVMVFHLTPTFGALGPAMRVYRSAAQLGWLGVDLFFVLSGFLITGILLGARDAPRRWTTFYARRTLRIFPLYYAALAGLALSYDIRPDPRVPNASWIAWCVAYLSNFGAVMPRRPVFPDAAWHFWSLAVEEQFYLVWPFVVWRTTPAQLLRVAGALVVTAAVTRFVLRTAFNIDAAYEVTFGRMDALVIGAVLAVWRRDATAWARARRWAGVAGAAAALLVLGIVAYHPHAEPAHVDARGRFLMQLIGYTLVAVASAAAVVRAADGGATGWLARGPLPWLGRYAYGLYVYHMIVAALVVPALFRAGWLLPDPGWAPGRATLAAVAAGFAITIPLAVASYHWFETPFLRLKQRFPSAGQPAPGGPAPAPRPAAVS